MTLENLLIHDLYKKSGQHIVIGGQTGSGKTHVLYFILDNLIKYHPQETIIWFDTGKSAEILRLSKFRPIKIFIPNDEKYDRSIRIEPRKEPINFETIHYNNIYEVFENLDKSKINIVSLEPFYFDETDEYIRLLDKFFRHLFKKAMNYSLDPPIAIFIDEMHIIAPSRGNAFSEEHTEAGARFQRNIERLRSAGVRIVGTIQDWTKLRRGVRTAFPWIIIKRGLSFNIVDLPQLARYNKNWWKLKTEDSVLVFPDRSYYENYIRTPHYEDGKLLGRVYYNEELKKPLPLPSLGMGTSAVLPPSCMPESILLH